MDDLNHDEVEAPEETPDQLTPAVEEDAPEVAEGDAGTSAQEESFTSLSIDDIEDEDARAVAELRIKQLQGDYTRKTMELAEQRKALEADAQRMAALRDESTRQDALRDLLAELDLEFVEDDEDQESNDDDYDVVEDPQVQALRERLDAMERAKSEQEQRAAQAELEHQMLSHITSALDSYAEKLGVEELPEHTQQGVLAHLAALPLGEDGMPQVQAAIAAQEAADARVIEHYLASKRTMTPDLSGSTGQPAVDLSDEKARLQHMNAVAEAALARHA